MNVARGEHGHDAGGRAHCVEVHRLDARMRPHRKPERRMQRAAQLQNVIGIRRRARNMQMRALVTDGLTRAHSYKRVAARLGCAVVSIKNLRSRLAATWRR